MDSIIEQSITKPIAEVTEDCYSNFKYMFLHPLDPRQEKQAFDTHYNYADCLTNLTNEVSISYKNILNPKELPAIGTKDNLIRLTKKSLEDEYKIVQIDIDYSYASTSWLPIKSYYLLFNMLLTIQYALTSREQEFSSGHIKCIERFTDMLEQSVIQFSNPILNRVFDGNIFNFREITGANLSRRVDIKRRYLMAMRKVSYYKLDEWKRKNKINLRTIRGKAMQKDYLQSFKISLFEFPYYMRIRSNYRDFAFIEGVSSLETKNYFETYYLFTRNLFNTLEKFKDKLVQLRS